MNINTIIIYVMVGFMILGAIDKIIGNKYGLGKKFDEGFMAMGSLAIAMIGIISLAPVLAKILAPIVIPVYTILGADPSMFATTFLANDMGGYPLAQSLALNPDAGNFAGLILGAMMGPTITFTIPVALGIIKKSDHKFLAIGVLLGLATIPVGCFFGGLVAGFSIAMILKNLIPIIIVALFLILSLWKAPEKTIRGFAIFAKGLMIVITIGIMAIVFETLTGFVIIPGMTPISESMRIIGSIAIILIGAFPMIYFLTKVFKKQLLKVGKYLGIGDIAAAGMIATLANNIPMFGMLKDMDNRGKVINIAFAVSAAFIFGDHLGFTAGVNQNMIFPMIIGKMTGGISAVVLAIFLLKSSKFKLDME